MIEEWHTPKSNRTQRVPHKPRKIQREWDRAKKTMLKREQKIGYSLRDVPISNFRQFRKSCATYQGREISGDPSISFCGRPNEKGWGVGSIGLYNPFERESKEELFILGKLPKAFKSHKEIDNTPMSMLECITTALITTKIDKDFQQLERAEKDVGTVPVEICVKDRHIEIVADGLDTKIDTIECVQCNRPYWLFSDFTRKNEKYTFPFAIDLPGFGWGAGGDAIGLIFYATTPTGEYVCTPECAQNWFDSWNVQLKDEAEVKEIIQSLVRNQSYDMGQITLNRYVGMEDPIWEVILFEKTGSEEKPYEPKRLINISLDRQITADEVY